MQNRRFFFILIVLQPVLVSVCRPETNGGWQKCEKNPVLGGNLGTCFDVAVLRDGRVYKMYFSWRPQRSLALVESTDGIHWSVPRIVLGPSDSGWEERINRPGIVQRDDMYHLWYTGQTRKQSYIGYATSKDGLQWQRTRNKPVLSPEEPWEKVAVMCPHVLWDPETEKYRMWYSAGDQYEPNAIGYATSKNGVHWQRWDANPIFRPDKKMDWEKHKVTACQVVHHDDWYIMFYIGFSDEHTAHIGLARSRNGITGWQRHPANPIIAPGKGTWDANACYKPFAIYNKQSDRWLLWYNGRRKRSEEIGLAFHQGVDLGWDLAPQKKKPMCGSLLLDPNLQRGYVNRFNANDEERYAQHIPNAGACDFLQGNIPLFECPDKDIEEIYNHSNYCDLVITGLVGLRPRADDRVEVNPLVPPGTWDWFCLDNVRYHSRILTILWDKTGMRYNKGKGFRIFADGHDIASTDDLHRLTGKLP